MSIPVLNQIENNVIGYATRDQLALIEHWAKEVPENGIIVEIGSFVGRSAWHWAKSAHPSVTVYAIDTWDSDLFVKYKSRRHTWSGNSMPREEVECCIEHFIENTKDCPNIIPVQARSPFLPPEIDEKLKQVDLVYIDDSHFNPEFQNNLSFWSKRIKPKGVFCGDDFIAPDVLRSVANYARKNRKQLYARSNFWRLYDWYDFIDLNQITVIKVKEGNIRDH